MKRLYIGIVVLGMVFALSLLITPSAFANQIPIAVAQISADGSAFSSEITVTQGRSYSITLSAAHSQDPDGWTAPGTGISQGGQCRWYTKLDNPESGGGGGLQLGQLVAFDTIINNPFDPEACTVAAGFHTFNDAPGMYTYNVLQITDAGGASSRIANIIVTVAAAQASNSAPIAPALIMASPLCDPFGYNSDCPTPIIYPTETGLPVLPPQTSINALAVIPQKLKEHKTIIAFALAAGTAALNAPLIVSNIISSLAQFTQFIGSFLSVRKRKDRWGIIVDSDFGRPIAQAAVQIFDAAFNRLKETQITGADGQFAFLLPFGRYYIIVSRPGFVFPARKKPPTTLRRGERLYLGEAFEIKDQDAEKIPHLIIPMDREEGAPANSSLFRLYWDKFIELIDKIGLVFLFAGVAINTYLFIVAPGILNTIFEILYLILLLFKLYILLFHQKGIGMVVDKATHKIVRLAVVRLYDAATNRIVQTRVTNQNGRFFILAPRGEYTASIAKPGYKTLIIDKLQIKSNTSKVVALNIELEPEK
ncbi:MAG: hypothetical protein A3E36_01260 [Candidatus Andersenbacteria bacterium RIFCSPHIGHO2_12_FULL_45_11b]|uniref:Carboxypeptidase regulatory-like domain-containing protein n=1 Tax=Candidatus Andersenbacteria bacterium RIFCSPHIGHO2_12_FULL_45_11b TaxID=1797282 RepID=A0A1G1XCA0_9BACT|nr:MAG: hypothetical protein A3E36_01260 [Candidatus Andersenbacteria bacterium RIFCSPHIGHO2_12_FULL_45_11b]